MASAITVTMTRILTVVAVLVAACNAHTWIEQMSLIGENGSFTGAYGYPRGYVARTDPGFNGFSNLWLIPDAASGRIRANADDLLCHPAQRMANQTATFPTLTVTPGSIIAMKYLENGHVSLPHNQLGKPEKGGTVFVYGTAQPKADEKLADVLLWTADGSGGDRRGSLIGVNNYDDDRCYQINSGPISTERQKGFPNPVAGQPNSQNEQWCETDVVLPNTLGHGSYTLYWVWDWPTLPGQDPNYHNGKDEFYTTCSDVTITSQLSASPISNQLTQQDPQSNAVKGYEHRSALVENPEGLAPLPGDIVTSKAIIAAETSSSSTSESTDTALQLVVRPLMPGTANGNVATVMPTATPHNAIVNSVPAATAQTLTALVTVVATLQPGETGVVVQGQHIVTFINSDLNMANSVMPTTLRRLRRGSEN